MTLRSSRRGERGSATMVVAVGGIALIAVTGLAIDGGMAAGAYRHAQNAADAGALAAVRQAYRTVQGVTSSTTPTAVAQQEVSHNNAQWVSGGSAGLLLPGSSASGLSTMYVPTSSSGVSGQAAFGDVNTTVSTGVLGVTADAHMLANVAQASTGVAPTAGSSWHGSWASAVTELGYASSTTLGETGYVDCSSAQAQYSSNGSTGTPTPCSPGTMPPQTTFVGTVVATGNPDAEVSSANVPTASPSMEVLQQTDGVGGVTLGASQVQSDVHLYWDATSGITSLSAVSATNVQATDAVNFAASGASLSVWLRISYDPYAGHPVITPQCTPGTISIGATVASEQPVSYTASCQPAGPLPSIPGVTLTMPYSSPSTDYRTACTQDSTSLAWTCSQVQLCLLRAQIPATSTTICLGEAIDTFSVTPVTVCSTTGSSTPIFPVYPCSFKVTATVPQPTYFMRVLGWTQTSPTASATAGAASVVDEAGSDFASSPFGIPAVATEMDAPYTLGALQPGHEYYLYGSQMQSNNPALSMPSAWQGQMKSDSGHRVGQTASGLSGLPTTSPHTYQGTRYFLEPVFDPASGVVLYYATFQAVPGQPNLGKLVNSDPLLNGPLLQATTMPTWTVLYNGAVAIKLVQ